VRCRPSGNIYVSQGVDMRLSSVVLLHDDHDDMYTLLVSFIFIILHCKDSLS
jgi:hypothetical protein